MSLTFLQLASITAAGPLAAAYGQGILSPGYNVVLLNEGVPMHSSLLEVQTFINSPLLPRLAALESVSSTGIWPVVRTFTLSGPIQGQTSIDGSRDILLDLTISDGALTQQMVNGLPAVLVDLQDQTDTANLAVANVTVRVDALESDYTNLTKVTVGLANVDNTSDADKPISVAVQAALDTLSSRVGSGDKTFEFDQVDASTLWTINHNLGKHPSVVVLDSAGTPVVCAVSYIDNNTVQVASVFSFAGQAFLN